MQTAVNPNSVDRFVDVASVVLISIAAVLTALCGYQSGRWGGQQARLYNIANADRTRSAEDADRANIMTAIEIGLFLRYIDALDAHDDRMAQFLDRRFPPELRSAMRAWLATKPLQNPHAPSSPFVMPQYSPRAKALAANFQRDAGENFKAAVEATHHSDDFLLLTVIFAGVSFLAGISTKMRYPRHAIIVALATVAAIYGVIRLVKLPFA
jgi:hypothetical protein